MLRFILILSISIFLYKCDGGPPAKVAGVQASSEHEAETGKYRAEWLLRSGAQASWVEGKPDDGIGETVTFLFDKKAKIQRIAIWNGYFDQKFFPLNNRVKEIAFSAEGGSETVYTLKDTAVRQDIELKEPLKGKQVRLKIVSVYKGAKWPDTALSGIKFYRETRDSFEDLGLSAELGDRIRSQYLEAFTDEFNGLYLSDRDSTEHRYLQIERNNRCRLVSLVTYNGNRTDRLCTWKRSEGKLLIREARSETDVIFSLENKELKTDGPIDLVDGDSPLLSYGYRLVMQEKSTAPHEYHPMDYIAKEEKSARGALDSHR